MSGNLGRYQLLRVAQKALSSPAEVCGGRCPVDLNFVSRFGSRWWTFSHEPWCLLDRDGVGEDARFRWLKPAAA